MRGRVSAVKSLFSSASNGLGALESGLTAALFGPVASVLSGGAGAILAVAAVAALWPQIRRFGALHPTVQEDEATELSPENPIGSDPLQIAPGPALSCNKSSPVTQPLNY